MTTLKFEASETETALANEWIKKHKKKCKILRARRRAGRVPAMGDCVLQYCFTPTGVGTALVVRCDCGESENVTDYGSW